MIDVCIIGAGPAGLTAALYALRGGLSVTLVEQGAPGGQLLKTDMIENYPGFAGGVSAFELASNMYAQVSVLPGFNQVSDTAKKVRKLSGGFSVEISTGTVEARSVIIATGGNPRLLEIPGEQEYAGKGVSYCAICDGFFFKEKTVAVIGGGNTALEDALYLSKIAKEVYLVHRRDSFRGSRILADKLKDHENLHLVMESVPVEIKGEAKVKELVLKNTVTEAVSSVFVDGVFVAIGQNMNSGFVKEIVALDDSNHILVDEKLETVVPGLFACGDVISKTLRQVSTAVGDGAVAGQMAYEYVNSL